MASTYVNDLRLEEIADGEQSGTWGATTNTNLELIGEALGFGTQAITTNADTFASTIVDGTSDQERSIYIKYTGALDSNCTITIGPNTISRLHFIENATTDSGSSGPYSIIISQGSGANVTIPNGDTKAVYLDGAGSGAAVVDAFASLNVVDLKVQDDLTVTDDASVGGDLLVSGEVQTANIGFTDGDNAMTIADGGAVTFPQTSVFTSGFTASAGATITTTDNTAQLTLVSTDADGTEGPVLDLYRNSSSPVDDDNIGNIKYFAENDAGEKIQYANILGYIGDASDGTEDGQLRIQTLNAGSNVNRISINTTETVINDTSKDLDFRVESDADANALFVEGSTSNVCINVATGNSANNGSLTIGHSGITKITAAANGNADELVLIGANASANVGMSIISNNANQGIIYFGDEDDTDIAGLIYDHSSNFLAINTNAGERVRVDASGNVGILNTSPSSYGNATELVVGNHSIDDAGITIATTTGSSARIQFADNTSDPFRGAIEYAHGSSDIMIFYTAGTSRMRVGSNILIGTADNSPAEGTNTGVRIGTNGTSQFSSSGDAALQANRTSDDGNVMRFYRNGTQEGEISCVANSGNGAIIIGHDGTGLLINHTGSQRVAPSDLSGGTIDNVTSLGWSNRRFSVVYAGTGTINTSDENEKQDIETLSDAEKRVAVVAKSLIKKYRWKDAVTKKGDNARIHIGLIAQDLEDAFKAEGLDASRYGMFCSDTWWEKEEKYTDDDGKEQTRLMDYQKEEDAPSDATKKTRLGVRYEELLAFIISAI